MIILKHSMLFSSVGDLLPKSKRVIPQVIFLSLPLLLASCSTSRTTTTKRTAIEELLISSAVDSALAKASFPKLESKTAFMDASKIESLDKGYVISSISDKLNQSNVNLVADRKEAKVIVEPRCGCLAINDDSFLIGLPQLPVSIPWLITFTIPEVALLSKVDQDAFAKFRLHAYDSKTGEKIMTSDLLFSNTYYNRWTILFYFKFAMTNIPELKDYSSCRFW